MARWTAALMALALVGCAAAGEDSPPAAASAQFTEAETFGSLPPSAATIAMRWQLLNADVNAFTFRNTHDVFAFRTVAAPAEARELAQGQAMALPAAMVDGAEADYAAWADRTFTNAFLVLKDGAVVFEDYRNRMTADTPHIAFSMTKTITAMLMGQALERGEIDSLDDLASKYVPALATGAYGRATLRNILEMRSGADIDERYDFGANPSLAGQIHETAIIRNERRFADFAVGLGSRTDPGSTFNYATLDTAVLGQVLEEATGQRFEDLMQDRLWQPIGAEYDGHFLADGPVGTGRALNGMGFNATLRDFARLGQLMLDDGMVGETRVLPEGWVGQMTAMKPTGAPAGAGFPGYGFQTWQVDAEAGAYSAVGLAGQWIYVHPATRTVIVKLSYHPPVEPAWLTPEVLGYFARVANAG
ncbi:MAG TPA: serine hydrolase [Paracoccaceae bacterium]|nr:serine hydrolase [Paracoccaceae bacterium]